MGKTSFLFLAAVFLAGVFEEYALADSPPAPPLSAPILLNDPLIQTPLSKPNAKNLSLQIRFINHGVKPNMQILALLAKATEVVYSSCEDVNFKINILGMADTSYTQLQDHLSDISKEGLLSVASQFFEFFEPWAVKKQAQTVDVHLVDHLDSQTRQEASAHQPITSKYLGQSYNSLDIESLYVDSRPEGQRVLPLAAYADSVILAYDTMTVTDGTQTSLWAPGSGALPNQPHVKKMIWKSDSVYLMAHELGHILFDRPMKDFIDHYCPTLGDSCTGEYLMSTGGFPHKVYYDPKKINKVIGYSPLPLIDKQQCLNLQAHPLMSQTTP